MQGRMKRLNLVRYSSESIFKEFGGFCGEKKVCKMQIACNAQKGRMSTLPIAIE